MNFPLKALTNLSLALAGIIVFGSCKADDDNTQGKPDFTPVEQGIEFADPFILLDDDT